MSTRPVSVSSRRRLAPRAAVLALGLPLVLGACSGGEDTAATGASSDPSDEAASSPSPTATGPDGSASPSVGTSPASGGSGGSGDGRVGTSGTGLPFPANTQPDNRTAGGGPPGSVTAVRLGAQDGYDRVVFELGPGSTPGWKVRYVDDPRTQGEGASVDLPGDATLQVIISGTGYPFDTGQQEYSGGDLRGGGTVTAVRFGGVFEGQTQAFIGVDRKTPFRVFLEKSPPRVVVDVVSTS